MNTRFPQLRVAALDSGSLDSLDGKTFVVNSGELDLACRLKLLPGADKLFIMLNGAVDRAKTPLPTFARWNWGKILGGHVLAICDPTLELDGELRLGWFLGRAGLNPTQTLTAVANKVRHLLHLDESQMIFYGSSGGGFAALIAASSLPTGRALCINPQTDINNYYPKDIERIAKVFDATLTATECRNRHPLRWCALEAIKASKYAGHDLRIFYAQNLVDDIHHKRHFKPFCESTASPIDGGLSKDGTVLTHVYNSPEGHGAEPPELVKFITNDGLVHLITAGD
jgi:hypothetical protein